MIQLNFKTAIDTVRGVFEHFRDLDLTDYPDELKFLDAGPIGNYSIQKYEQHEASKYRNCFASFKQDDSDKWETFDDILRLLEWIACGKYQRVHVPPDGDSNCRYYRLTSLGREEAPKGNHFPAQFRISTPGTYMSEHPRAYIHLKIDRKLAGETRWTIDEEFGLHGVLRMLETGAYGMDEPDIDKRERIFRRLY